MKGILKLLVNALAVLASAFVVPGVEVGNFYNALIIALVLALLNVFIKPVFIVLTLPFTLLTLGIFLLFVNVFMIMIADYLLDSFAVGSFWNAVLFSLILWLINSAFEKLFPPEKPAVNEEILDDYEEVN